MIGRKFTEKSSMLHSMPWRHILPLRLITIHPRVPIVIYHWLLIIVSHLAIVLLVQVHYIEILCDQNSTWNINFQLFLGQSQAVLCIIQSNMEMGQYCIWYILYVFLPEKWYTVFLQVQCDKKSATVLRLVQNFETKYN